MIALPPGPFDVLLVDPPWDYDNRVQHGGKGKGYTSGAQAFYPTMKPLELISMRPEVQAVMAANSLVYMWTTGPQAEIAMRVLRAWGAPFKTVAFCWDKRRVNPGAYTMSQCEFVLVGKRGSIPKPRGARNIRQLIYETRTKHSAKPDEVRRRIDLMHPEARILEMFARTAWPNWTAWGDEAPDV